MRTLLAALAALLAVGTPRSALAQSRTFCLEGAQYTCFGVELQTAPSGAGTDVTIRLRNLQGSTLANVPAQVAWSGIYGIDLVAPAAAFTGGFVMNADPIVIADSNVVERGDSRETWFAFNVGDSTTGTVGFGLETPYRANGAEIVGCGLPPGIGPPYFQTCDPTQSAMVEFRFSTDGPWQAEDVGLIIGITDPYGADMSCLIPGMLYDDATAYHCLDPTAPPANLRPVANAAGPYTASEGSSLTLEGGGSFDPDGDPLTYDWDFGDGSPHGSGTNPSHVYADDFAYTVTLRVSDGSLTSEATTLVTISDVSPVVDAGPGGAVLAGEEFRLAATFTDPGSDAPWGISIDWGDGSMIHHTGSDISGARIAPSHSYIAPGTFSVIVSVFESDGGIGAATTQVTVTRPNSAPVASVGGPYAGEEGSAIAFSGVGSTDPDDDALTYAWTFGDGSTGTGIAPSHAYPDNRTYSVTLTVTDEHGVSSSPVSTTAIITNVAPTITGLTLPAGPVPVGSPVALTGGFTDPSTLDTHGATVDWADGTGAASAAVNQSALTVSASHTFSTAGVYAVTLVVSDDDGGSATAVATNYVVIYDPSAGFVTGGGWITSPVGAYPARPALTGKASFGFVSRYKKGAATPSGNTEFQFHVASLEFNSSSYQWLVVGGPRAQFKGTGTVNGTANYGFLLSAVDGQVNGGGGTDRFRIKIWDNATGTIVYDNQMNVADDMPASTALGGGSIVIHP